VKYLKKIERLVQEYPGGRIQIPRTLLKVAKGLKEYTLSTNGDIKNEDDALRDGVERDLRRNQMEFNFEKIAIKDMRFYGLETVKMTGWDIKMLWLGDRFGCDLAPAPPMAQPAGLNSRQCL
jgi:hypothetical protein